MWTNDGKDVVGFGLDDWDDGKVCADIRELCNRIEDGDEVADIFGTDYLGRAQRAEWLVVGERVVVASDWKCRFYCDVGPEVFSVRGETLGYYEPDPYSFKRDDPHAHERHSWRNALACMLPHLDARIYKLAPLSRRSRTAKRPFFRVRLTFLSGRPPVEQIAEQEHRILSMERGARPVLLSHGPLVPERLNGAIGKDGDEEYVPLPEGDDPLELYLLKTAVLLAEIDPDVLPDDVRDAAVHAIEGKRDRRDLKGILARIERCLGSAGGGRLGRR